MGDVVEQWLIRYNALTEWLKSGHLLPIECEARQAVVNQDMDDNVRLIWQITEIAPDSYEV